MTKIESTTENVLVSTTESVLEKRMNEIINANRNISQQLERNSEKLKTIGQEVHFLKESIADLHSKGKTKY